MNEVNTTALLERVKRLERQNKLIKLAGIVSVLGMALILCCGAKEKVPKEIVAESFRVVDTQGRTRATLSVGQEGPSLTLSDEKGNPRAGLSVLSRGSGLILLDKKGNFRVGLSVSSGEPGLVLLDKKENLRAGFSVSSEGPVLSLLDKNGKTVFSAP